MIQDLRESTGGGNALAVLNNLPALKRKLGELGDEAARTLLPFYRDALERFDEVLVLTHVPPFREACWHQGRISDDAWLPGFTCKAMGQMLIEGARDHPDREVTVLCGHTHGSGEAHILKNLVAITGEARYGAPGSGPIDCRERRGPGGRARSGAATRCSNRYGAFASLVMALAMNFLLYYLRGERLDHWDPFVFLVSLGAGVLALVLASTLTAPEPDESCRSFFDRLQTPSDSDEAASEQKSLLVNLLHLRRGAGDAPLLTAYRTDLTGLVAGILLAVALVAGTWLILRI